MRVAIDPLEAVWSTDYSYAEGGLDDTYGKIDRRETLVKINTSVRAVG